MTYSINWGATQYKHILNLLRKGRGFQVAHGNREGGAHHVSSRNLRAENTEIFTKWSHSCVMCQKGLVGKTSACNMAYIVKWELWWALNLAKQPPKSVGKIYLNVVCDDVVFIADITRGWPKYSGEKNHIIVHTTKVFTTWKYM